MTQVAIVPKRSPFVVFEQLGFDVHIAGVLVGVRWTPASSVARRGGGKLPTRLSTLGPPMQIGAFGMMQLGWLPTLQSETAYRVATGCRAGCKSKQC